MASNEISPSPMTRLNNMSYYLPKEVISELISDFTHFNQFLNGGRPMGVEQKINEINRRISTLTNLHPVFGSEDRQSAACKIKNPAKVKLINSLVMNKDFNLNLLEKHLKKVNETSLKEFLIEENDQTNEYLKSLEVKQTANENSSNEARGSPSASTDRPPETADNSDFGTVDEPTEGGEPSGGEEQTGAGETTEEDEPTEEEPIEEEPTDAEKRVETNEGRCNGGEQLKRKAEQDREKASPSPKRAKTADRPSPNKPSTSRASPRTRIKVNKKYQSQVMEIMQEAGEAYLTEMFGGISELAAHGSRKTGMKKNMDLLKRLSR